MAGDFASQYSRFDGGRVKRPLNPFLATIFVFAFSALGFSSAANIYITPNGSAQGVCTTNPQTPSWFNSSANWGSGSSQIGPGTIVTICGTFTGSAGGTEFTFQGSGASGSPITLLFDSATTLSAPYWSGTSGAVNISGKSYITINGQNVGSIQNSANGDGLNYQQSSIGVYGPQCNNCAVENLTISNIYVAIQNYSSPLGGLMTSMNAIYLNGKKWTISGSTIHDCGWCIYDVYQNADTNTQVFNNNIYNWDHGMMFATGGANSCTAPCLLMHDNQFGSNINFETAGCVYHLDGLHTFGTSGSSMDGVYIYNNYFSGRLAGGCSSGFIFIEGGGSSTPSNLKNLYFWNNVGDATGADSVNANGWFGLFSASASMLVANNTLLYNNTNDMTECFAVGGSSGGNVVNNLTFENNIVNGCNLAIYLPELTGTTTIDRNFYGDACTQSNNCLIWKSTFEGAFTPWKSACACDPHSLISSYAGALLNSDGSPQSGSPVIGAGINLSSLASGYLASLQDDTSKGDTRTPQARPTSGNWDIGAYLYGSGGGAPQAPTGLAAVVH
jgi:hypothetical protein